MQPVHTPPKKTLYGVGGPGDGGGGGGRRRRWRLVRDRLQLRALVLELQRERERHAQVSVLSLLCLAVNLGRVHFGADAVRGGFLHRQLERLLQLRLKVILLTRRHVARGRLAGGDALGELLEGLERLQLELHVPLHHHLFERHEVVDRQDLLEHLAADVAVAELFAGGCEVLGGDAHVIEVQLHQGLDHLLERSVDVHVSQLILFLGIKDDAVVVDEAHDGQRPLGALEEADDRVEQPRLLVCARHPPAGGLCKFGAEEPQWVADLLPA
mmetsp:Transcript_15323/g.38973  ORF Transcript_15323/g.38973 Transcript_15323/m.38973 type:complete len:270 (-) Transcript_15323:13-822(-)